MTYSKIVLTIVILVSVAHTWNIAAGDSEIPTQGFGNGNGSVHSSSGSFRKSWKRIESNQEEMAKINGGRYGGGDGGVKSSGPGGGEQRIRGKSSGEGSQFVIYEKIRRSAGSGLGNGEIGGYIILSHEVQSKGNGGYHYVGEHSGVGDGGHNNNGRGVGYNGYNNDGRGGADGNGGGKRSVEPIANGKGIATNSGIKPQNTITNLPPNGKHNENGNRNVRPVISVNTASNSAKFENKNPTRTSSRPVNTTHGGHGKVNVGPAVGGTRGTQTNLQSNGVRPQSSIGPHPMDRGITANVKVTAVPFFGPISSTGTIKTNAGPVNSPQWNINTSNISRVPNTSKRANGQNGNNNGRKNVGPTLAVGAKVISDPNSKNKTKSNRPVTVIQNGNSDAGKHVGSTVLVAAKVNSWIPSEENTKSNNGSVGGTNNNSINGNKTTLPTTSQRGNNSGSNESKIQGSSHTDNGKVNVEPILVQNTKMEDKMKKSSGGSGKSEKPNNANTGKRNIGSIIGTKSNSSRITEVDAGLLSSEKPNHGNGRRNVGATIGDKHGNGGNGRRHIGSTIGGKNNTSNESKSNNGSVSSEIGSPKRNIGTIIGEKIKNGISDAGKTESGNGTLSIEKENVGNGKTTIGSVIGNRNGVLPGGGQNISLTVDDHTQPSSVSDTRPYQDGPVLQDIPLFDILSFR